jgi:hypothetical protein
LPKILVMAGATIGGAIGWWLGDFIGLMTAVILGGIGTGVGMYLVLKLEREHLS